MPTVGNEFNLGTEGRHSSVDGLRGDILSLGTRGRLTGTFPKYMALKRIRATGTQEVRQTFDEVNARLKTLNDRVNDINTRVLGNTSRACQDPNNVLITGGQITGIRNFGVIPGMFANSNAYIRMSPTGSGNAAVIFIDDTD